GASQLLLAWLDAIHLDRHPDHEQAPDRQPDTSRHGVSGSDDADQTHDHQATDRDPEQGWRLLSRDIVLRHRDRISSGSECRKADNNGLFLFLDLPFLRTGTPPLRFRRTGPSPVAYNT